MWALILSIPLRLRKRPDLKVILYNAADKPQRRIYYYRKYAGLGQSLPDNSILAVSHERFLSPLYVQKLGWKQIRRLLKAAALLSWATFSSTFTRTRVFPHWKLKFANMLLQQVAFFGDDTDQMLFYCYEPDTYLSSLTASALMPGYNPKVGSSNSLLFRDNRYLYHPNLDLKLCSRIQETESKFYMELGWMKVGNMELWGLEEADVMDNLKRAESTVDIGVYSSGFWARTELGWRVEDVERIRRGEFLGNRWYRILLDILDACAALKRDYPQLKVKVYPHPLELTLLRNHDIVMPYAEFVQREGFELSLDGDNSLERFYEAKIGLASQSTIIFDRLHHGLDSYFYAGKENWTSIDMRYLGEFSRFGFGSSEELKDKLKQNLGLEAPNQTDFNQLA